MRPPAPQLQPSGSFLYFSRAHRDLHSFPTRRSSDLPDRHRLCGGRHSRVDSSPPHSPTSDVKAINNDLHVEDRKSTRLNSSHSQISYAVFCLKKKTQQTQPQIPPSLYNYTTRSLLHA